MALPIFLYLHFLPFLTGQEEEKASFYPELRKGQGEIEAARVWEQEFGSTSVGAGVLEQGCGSRSVGAGVWEQECWSRSMGSGT